MSNKNTFSLITYVMYVIKRSMENKKLKPRIVRWNKKYSYIYIAPETKKEMKKAAMNMGLTLNVYVAEMFYRYGFEFSQVPKEQRTETVDVVF